MALVWAKFLKIFAFIYVFTATVTSMLGMIWQSAVEMARCKFCWAGASLFLKNLAGFFVNPQKFIYDSVQALKIGVDPKFAGYYVNLIVIGSLMTIMFIILIYLTGRDLWGGVLKYILKIKDMRE